MSGISGVGGPSGPIEPEKFVDPNSALITQLMSYLTWLNLSSPLPVSKFNAMIVFLGKLTENPDVSSFVKETAQTVTTELQHAYAYNANSKYMILEHGLSREEASNNLIAIKYALQGNESK